MRAPSKILVVATFLFAACGGSSDSRPGPLKAHYDDMHIARVSMDQRGAENTSRNDWSVAKMENAKSEGDYKAIDAQLTVVRNDREKARLNLSSAQSEKKTADSSKDQNQINNAIKDVHNAELSVKAADSRIKYYEAYRAYLRVLWRFNEENMYWREAQYELAKSQVGQKNNIAPQGITYDSFPKQESDRNKRAAGAKAKLDAEKAHASSAREEWLKAQQTADQASGKPSSFPDPMMASGTPATAGTP